jgi:hypothetical protein
MDGLERWATAEWVPPRPLPVAATIGVYLVFFAALGIAYGVEATPARMTSGLLMGVSAAAWLMCVLYRRSWEASHRRNRHGILVAGDPALEIAAYYDRLGISVQVLAGLQTLAVFVALPTALLALSLFATSCLLSLITR